MGQFLGNDLRVSACLPGIEGLTTFTSREENLCFILVSRVEDSTEAEICWKQSTWGRRSTFRSSRDVTKQSGHIGTVNPPLNSMRSIRQHRTMGNFSPSLVHVWVNISISNYIERFEIQADQIVRICLADSCRDQRPCRGWKQLHSTASACPIFELTN